MMAKNNVRIVVLNNYPWHWHVVIASRWYPDIAYQNEPMIYYGHSSTWEKARERVLEVTRDYPPTRVNIQWEPYNSEINDEIVAVKPKL